MTCPSRMSCRLLARLARPAPPRATTVTSLNSILRVRRPGRGVTQSRTVKELRPETFTLMVKRNVMLIKILNSFTVCALYVHLRLNYDYQKIEVLNCVPVVSFLTSARPAQSAPTVTVELGRRSRSALSSSTSRRQGGPRWSSRKPPPARLESLLSACIQRLHIKLNPTHFFLSINHYYNIARLVC